MAGSTNEPSSWWNPCSQSCRVVAASFSYLVLGLIDASYGALIPYLTDYYELSYTLISLIFLPPVIGYIISALLNEPIHRYFGHRGVADIGPLCHLVTAVVAVFHPPYPVLLFATAFSGFGNGILDAAWNSWFSSMPAANELMGLLHGTYGVGAVGSPLIATAIITKGHKLWSAFYYVLIAIAATELFVCGIAFSRSGPKGHSRSNDTAEGEKELPQTQRSVLWASLKKPTTWIISLLGFFYMGTEVSIGGWLPSYLLSTRNASAFEADMALVGFWLGLVIGTFVLAFVTGKLGQRIVILVSLGLAMSLQLIVWLVPRFLIATVATALTGFFIGPIFPTAIIVAIKLLPKDLHVTAVGIISTIGCAGSSVFPSIVGIIAEKAGVKILPPFVVGLLVLICLMWVLAVTRKFQDKKSVGHQVQPQC